MWAEIGYGLLIILIWEWIGIRIRKELKWRFISPTSIINFITRYARICFNQIGQGIAYVSSFYIYLHLEDLAKAGWDLLSSIWKLFCSALEVGRGYLTTSFTFKRSYLVYIGTVTLLAVGLFAIYYWLDFNLANFDFYAYGLLGQAAVILVVGIYVGTGSGLVVSAFSPESQNNRQLRPDQTTSS